MATAAASPGGVAAEARRVLARRVLEARRAAQDPGFFMSFCVGEDERTGQPFYFRHLREPIGPDEKITFDGDVLSTMPLTEKSWRWQRAEIDSFHRNRRVIRLKARQLGETWLGCGYLLWTALYQPGSLCLVYRQKEDDALKNIKRVWQLYASLPVHLRNKTVLEKPARVPHPIPTGELRFRFESGAASTVMAQSSASASGHGDTAAIVMLDEFSRIEKAEQIMDAVSPAAGSLGRLLIISTANGTSNPETGEGNEFHRLWINSEEASLDRRFLPWSLHPDRDQRWYDSDPEVRMLKPHKRAEQYPANEEEAFMLSNRVFFDAEDLMWYGKHRVRDPLYRADFVPGDNKNVLATGSSGVLAKWERPYDAIIQGRVDEPTGAIRIYANQVPDRKYAVGADVATGDGMDYSVAYVIDLATAELVAELRQRYAPDVYAAQLHFLGRKYNTAKIAVETQGGYGDAVIAALRDGTAGRPAYPNIYRHRLDSQAANPEQKRFGWPTNIATRPKILNQLERHIRERSLPWVTRQLLGEMRTFIEDTKKRPSPRAQPGAHDDCVFAASIALEMYRQYGDFPEKKRSGRRKSARPPVPYPWQKAA